MQRGRRRITVAAPTVVAPDAPTLTAPADESDVYPGVAVTVSATVTAGQVPDRIDFVLDPGVSEEVIATDSASPFSQSWTPTEAQLGAHTLVARFVYGSGSVDSTAIDLVVFDPTLDANLVAWLDPNDPADGAVTTWTARAGSGLWAPTQATGGLKPTAVAAAGIAGGNVVRFAAASSQLLVQATGAQNQPCTVLTLVKSAAANGSIFTVLDGSTVNTRRIYSVAGPAINLYAGEIVAGSGGRILQSAWIKLGGVFNGASSKIRSYGTVDGTQVTDGDAGAGAATGLTLGSYGGGGGYFDGDMGHVVVIARALSNAEIDRFFAWMNVAP